jgi:lysophospholipase L1-like esterase
VIKADKSGAAAGILAVAAAFAALMSTPAVAGPSHRCLAQRELARLDHVLPRVRHQVAAGLPLKIVAFGSSSTAGTGASSKSATYPSRLAVELSTLMHGATVTVVNRGVGGEEARDMLRRLDKSVLSERPDLVLWQVGTNAVLNDYPLPPASRQIDEVVRRIRARGIDIVLMDPQFAPKVLAKPETPGMVKLLAQTAKHYDIDVFPRFALMRHWREVEDIPFADFLSRDQLHMNDWSYACVAKVLAASIMDAVTRPITAASVQTGTGGSLRAVTPVSTRPVTPVSARPGGR